MTVYALVLFVHIVGAIGYCIGIGAWLFVLLGFWRVQRVAQLQTLIYLNDLSGPVGAGSVVLLLVAGLYLALTTGILLADWIIVALVSLLLMVPTTALLIAPRRRVLVRLAREEAPDGMISETLKMRLHDPVLFTVPLTVMVLLLGLVFLMTTKPDLMVSLIVMVALLLFGVASGVLVAWLKRPSPAQPRTETIRSIEKKEEGVHE